MLVFGADCHPKLLGGMGLTHLAALIAAGWLKLDERKSQEMVFLSNVRMNP